MTHYVIELLGLAKRAFVEGYSNTHACPGIVYHAGQAKTFATEGEAEQWGKSYLPGHRHKVLPLAVPVS